MFNQLKMNLWILVIEFIKLVESFVMRYLFVFFLVSMSSIVLCQNRYHVDKTTFALEESVVYLKHDMKPINGVLYCNYGDIGRYINGKIDGVHRAWYDNGQIRLEVNCNEGIPIGLSKGWHKNGQIKFEYYFKDGYRYGLCKEWFENGQLHKELNYNKFLLHSRYWYKNGQLKKEREDKDGNGSCKEWYENGRLRQKYDIEDGIHVNKKCFGKEGIVIECD